MAVTLKQTEALTEQDAAWQRIEAYIAYRFTERAVVWIVEGAGEWCAPLTPATVTEIEIWNGAAWETITAPDSPLGGYWLSGDGPYRFTATVGGGDVPAVVTEAHTRLSNYLASVAADDMPDGASSYSVSLGGEVREQIDRNPKAIAMAIQLSGAADLLRPYRKA